MIDAAWNYLPDHPSTSMVVPWYLTLGPNRHTRLYLYRATSYIRIISDTFEDVYGSVVLYMGLGQNPHPVIDNWLRRFWGALPPAAVLDALLWSPDLDAQTRQALLLATPLG